MQETQQQPLFSLGQVVATPGALAALEKAGQTPLEFLARHVRGDWGELSEEDRKESQFSLERGFRLLSCYPHRCRRHETLGDHRTESGTNPRKTFDEGSLEELPKASAAKACSRRSWCGERTIISKSSPEQDALEPRRWRVCEKFLSASLHSRTRKPLKRKLWKTFFEATFIPSRRRKAFARCWTAKEPATP